MNRPKELLCVAAVLSLGSLGAAGCGGKLLAEGDGGTELPGTGAGNTTDDSGESVGQSSSSSSGSSSGTTSGSSSGSTSGSSSGGGSKTGTTACGKATCDNATQVCCANLGGAAGGVAGGGGTGGATATCTAIGACMGATIGCISSASCSNGDVCCFSFGAGGLLGGGGGMAAGGGATGGETATCMAACATGSYQLCAKTAECPKGDTCMASPIGEGNYCAAAGGAAGGGAGGLGGLGGL